VFLPEQNQKSRFSSEWRLKLSGVDLHDERRQSKTIGLAADLKSQYLLSKSLKLDIQPTIKLQTGQSQSFDGADAPENKIVLNQAALQYSVNRNLKLAGGALNQGSIHSSLLVDPIAFPAIRIESPWGDDNFKVTITAESAIPTSTSLSSNTKELEATPSLNALISKLNWRANDLLNGKLGVGFFIFGNLPSSVAQKSFLLGNNVNKLSEAEYRFQSDFEGFEAIAEIEFHFSSAFKGVLGGEYLTNQKAGRDENSGYLFFGKGITELPRDKELQLSGGYFNIAPDAAVSYFNASGFETNRVGYYAEVQMAFKKEAFSLGLRFSEADVMFSSTVQSREQMLLLKMETFYANL